MIALTQLFISLTIILLFEQTLLAQDKIPQADETHQEVKVLGVTGSSTSQKDYPGKGSLQTEVGLAQIALSKKDYVTAKEKLDPIKIEALKLKDIPEEAGPAYSKAFCLLGEVEEALGNYVPALQDYLRTVTCFYHNATAVATAQEKADNLRKEHNISVP